MKPPKSETYIEKPVKGFLILPKNIKNSQNSSTFKQRLLMKSIFIIYFLFLFSHGKELYSPSPGTDINTHPIALLKCNNQTSCISPELQLEIVFNVYYCKHVSYGVRFYFLVREGLLLHPNINLVENPDLADIIIYLPESAQWTKSECSNPIFSSKLVVLDESDGPNLFDPGPSASGPNWHLLYFKRSYVKRSDGAFRGYMSYLNRQGFSREDHIVLPLTYSIADAYVRSNYKQYKDRDLELVCTLRGSNFDPTRLRIRQWVKEYAVARGLKSYIAGEVNSASRTVVSRGYFEKMHSAKIILTSNPSHWEGDFRLMEALASGALIFVDKMYVPRPFPLKNNKHLVYYDNMNKTDVFEKLDKFRGDEQLSRHIATRGYLHSMKFHRAANLIDYVMRTIHLYLMRLDKRKGKITSTHGLNILSNYTQTGFDMRQIALTLQEKRKKTGGLYGR